MQGEVSVGVDDSIMTFVNHGCNGTYNVGTKLNETELTVDIGQVSFEVWNDGNEVYNPFDERQFPFWQCNKFVTLRDMQANEELLDNYLVFGGDSDLTDWEQNLRELKEICSGRKGKVAIYDEDKRLATD